MTANRIPVVAALAVLAACGEPDTLPAGPGDAAEPAALAVRGLPRGLVFHSTRDGDAEIYLMERANGAPRQFTDNDVPDLWPDLSPSGHYVAYASGEAGKREIYVQNVKTGMTFNLSNHENDDDWPRWSPDGKWLAFHSNRSGDYEIYIVEFCDDPVPRRVTWNPLGIDQWPDWSPDGKRLAFRRGTDVWVIDAFSATEAEQNPRQLTIHPALDQMPAWSPKGNQIAFMSMRDGYCSVLVMGAEGETPERPAVNLTPMKPGDPEGSWCSRAPSWSRNVRQIYFSSYRPETRRGDLQDFELYVMNADGSGVRRLTEENGEDGGPRVR